MTRKIILYLIFAALAGFWIYWQFFNYGTEYQVDSAKFSELSKDADVVILDVRSAFEFRGDKIAGAKNVSFSRNFGDSVKDLDKEKTYLVYCATGTRSEVACAMMKDIGFKKIYDLSGGIDRWKSDGMPVVR